MKVRHGWRSTDVTEREVQNVTHTQRVMNGARIRGRKKEREFKLLSY